MTRLSQGENKNRKRIAMMATVYSIVLHIHRLETIMGFKKEADDFPSSRPQTHNKQIRASVERNPDKVTEELF